MIRRKDPTGRTLRTDDTGRFKRPNDTGRFKRPTRGFRLFGRGRYRRLHEPTWRAVVAL